MASLSRPNDAKVQGTIKAVCKHRWNKSMRTTDHESRKISYSNAVQWFHRHSAYPLKCILVCREPHWQSHMQLSKKDVCIQRKLWGIMIDKARKAAKGHLCVLYLWRLQLRCFKTAANIIKKAKHWEGI